MGLGRGALLLWLGVPIPVIICLRDSGITKQRGLWGYRHSPLALPFFSLARSARRKRVLANTRSTLAAAAAALLS